MFKTNFRRTVSSRIANWNLIYLKNNKTEKYRQAQKNWKKKLPHKKSDEVFEITFKRVPVSLKRLDTSKTALNNVAFMERVYDFNM